MTKNNPDIVKEDLGTQVLTKSNWDYLNQAYNLGLTYEPSNAIAADFQISALQKGS